MSENEVDNEIEIIETETIAADDQEVKPVDVKKGSLMNFLAFVFATGALALSGYQYYMQQQKPEPVKETKSWQAPIKTIKTELTTLQTSTSELSTQLQALQDSIEILKEQKQTGAKPLVFDASEINQNISQIQTQLKSQQNLIQQLQEKATQNKQQSFQQNTAEPSINEAQLQQTRNLLLINISLQSAQTQLNILGNVDKAKKALQQAIEQLNSLSKEKYSNFAKKLEAVTETLNSSKKVDLFGLNKQIDALEYSGNKLEFNQSNINSSEATAWYDKLITIKKIDDNQQALLTRSEKESIRQRINIHFSLLRKALVNQNNKLWLAEIIQLEKMFTKHFTGSAESIIRQINRLKYKNINPDLPDLSVYLQQLDELILTDSLSE